MVDFNKIPRWFKDSSDTREFSIGGQRWFATNCVMLACSGEATDGEDCRKQVVLPTVKAQVDATATVAVTERSNLLAVPSRAYIPDDEDGGETWSLRIDLGPVAVQARFVALVEKLFGPVNWYAPNTHREPAHAVNNGKIVAVVMPVKGGSRSTVDL